MVEWLSKVFAEGILGSLEIIKTLVIIIIPLMVVLQIMTDYKWIEKLSERTKWITDFLGVSKNTLIPLLIGVFVGVSYGAGAIIFAKEKYNIAKDDIFLAMCFLLPLHGIIDSTIVLWVMGVHPAILLGSRLFVALTGTLLFKWRIGKRKNKDIDTLNDTN